MKQVPGSISAITLRLLISALFVGGMGCGAGDSAETKSLANLEAKAAVQTSLNSEQQVVTLKCADLQDAEAEALRAFPQLHKLVLSGSRVGKSMSVLAELPQLQELELENTDVADADLAALSKLLKLRMLNLAGCNISDEGLQHLKALSGLESLNLNRTKIRGAGLVSITGHGKLETLSLQEAPIQTGELPSLAGLSSLRVLHLAKTPADGTLIPLLSDLPKLERLYLDGTKISDNDIAQLAAVMSEKTPQVKGLFFDDTALSDASVESFRGFSTLKQLAVIHLGGTKISLEGYIKLRQTLPDVNLVSQY